MHTKVLPSFGSRAQTAGAAIAQHVESDARNRLLVVGTRGMGAIKRCACYGSHVVAMKVSTPRLLPELFGYACAQSPISSSACLPY